VTYWVGQYDYATQTYYQYQEQIVLTLGRSLAVHLGLIATLALLL